MGEVRDRELKMNNPNPFQAAKSKLKTSSTAENPRHGHGSLICEEFNNEFADYECYYVEDYADDYQDYLDYYAEYFGCELELCGLTAGAQQVSTTAAPLLLALLFWLFK